MKYVMVTLLIIASLLGVFYTLDAVKEAEDQRVEEPKDNEMRIVASNFALDKDEYVVQQGEPVVLSMINESGYHEFGIEGFDINLTEDEPIEMTFDEAGTYTIYCSFLCGPGHSDMVSTLVVEGGAGDAPDNDANDDLEDANNENEEQDPGNENEAEAAA